MTQSPTRMRPARNDSVFLFKCSTDLLTEARSVAAENQLSVSAFIRQAVKRNLNAYERLR